jgi:hypothetical protein
MAGIGSNELCWAGILGSIQAAWTDHPVRAKAAATAAFVKIRFMIRSRWLRGSDRRHRLACLSILTALDRGRLTCP